MAVNPFDNQTFSMMYKDALYSLYAGAVMPHEREILAMAPLPADVVDPFASQDVDPRQIMGFAYNSLVTWIDEAKKANYFSKRFTDLSKLVMKGVMTMGRGLVTLHNRGEDLSQAPMQIGELISVSSYHFRKSYLGVIQTAKSHPEISERLLINQLSWTNLLLRLYKTRDKLASGVRGRGSGISKDSGFRIQGSENSEGGMRNSESLPDTKSALNHGHALPDVAALFEPAALAAPRALSSLDGSKSPSGSRRNVLGTLSNAECGMRNSELGIVNSEDHISKTCETKTPEAMTEEAKNSRSVTETVNSPAEEKSSEAETSGITDDPQAGCEEAKTDVPEREITEDKESHGSFLERDLSPGDSNEVTGDDLGRKELIHEVSTDNLEQSSSEIGLSGKPDNPERAEGEESPGIFSDPGGNKLIHETGQPTDDPPELSPGSMDKPFYLEVLHHAFARSADNEDDKIIFTTDEICYLAHDPAFAEIYPDQAADMRRILAQLIRDGDGFTSHDG